jgi:hypothetical protein
LFRELAVQVVDKAEQVARLVVLVLMGFRVEQLPAAVAVAAGERKGVLAHLILLGVLVEQLSTLQALTPCQTQAHYTGVANVN